MSYKTGKKELIGRGLSMNQAAEMCGVSHAHFETALCNPTKLDKIWLAAIFWPEKLKELTDDIKLITEKEVCPCDKCGVSVHLNHVVLPDGINDTEIDFGSAWVNKDPRIDEDIDVLCPKCLKKLSRGES